MTQYFETPMIAFSELDGGSQRELRTIFLSQEMDADTLYGSSVFDIIEFDKTTEAVEWAFNHTCKNLNKTWQNAPVCDGSYVAKVPFPSIYDACLAARKKNVEYIYNEAENELGERFARYIEMYNDGLIVASELMGMMVSDSCRPMNKHRN